MQTGLISTSFLADAMLKSSFIILEGIGKEKEKKLWQSGVHDWHDFRRSSVNISPARKRRLDNQLAEAGRALISDNSEYFKNLLPQNEMWRLFSSFKEDALYLDIETTGLMDGITVIGLFDGRNTVSLVRGYNLDKNNLRKALNKAKILVTFNGASFDLPIIEKHYPGMINIPHIDLKTACARCGFKGGLKKIERLIGIRRTEQIQRMHGGDAALLWRYFQATSDSHYLDILREYNEEDTVNLQRLAEITCLTLEKEIKRKYFCQDMSMTGIE